MHADLTGFAALSGLIIRGTTMKKLLPILTVILLAACSASVVTPAPTARPPTASPPVTATTVSRQDPTSSASRVFVVAHRGGAALAPENTLGAFANALKIGVDMIECDVHLSKDGKLVVMHDPDLSRTTDGRGQISELTLAEIKKLNAAAKFADKQWSPQAVPTLGELLDLAKGKAGVQIEIKVGAGNKRYDGIERKVVDAVNARGMTNDVIVISFDFPTIQEIKRIDPRIKTGALSRGDWVMARSVEQIAIEIIESTGADYFMPTAGALTEAMVKALHARGTKVGVWTVNAPQDMRRLADWGVDAITSDKPDELKRVLGR
jgi:glycerophosphoryl diester phosphodiesterase